MSIRRIGVLLRKELRYGFKSYIVIFAIVAPLIFTIFVNLLFGSLFSGKPKLGVTSQGHSQIVESLRNMESVDLKEYSSEIELKDAVETGARDVGVVLGEDFDSTIRRGELTRLTVYVWGESLLKDRAIIESAILYQIRDVSGEKAPVEITPISLGDAKSIPLKDRLLPLIVLMAIFISGFAIPSASLVDEKQKRTIGAVMSTPATQGDIFVSKGLMGIVVSLIMGILILVLNQAFNAHLSLIILILSLAAIMASCLGLIIGAFIKDTASLYSVIKGLGLVIYGPGIIKIFPQIPERVGKLFPTYYVINPIMEITREGGGWSTVSLDVYILIGIIAVFIVVVGVIIKNTRQQEV